MNSIIASIVKCFVVGSVMWPLAAFAEIEFVGYLKGSDSITFALCDTDTKSTGGTAWLKIGDEFLGYTVASYDEQSEDLYVRDKNSTRKLHLKSTIIKDAHVEINGRCEFKDGTSVDFVYNAPAGSSQSFPLSDGRKLTLKVKQLDGGKVQYGAQIMEKLVAPNHRDQGAISGAQGLEGKNIVRKSATTVVVDGGRTVIVGVDDVRLTLKN